MPGGIRESVELDRGVFNFTLGDAVVAFAKKNGESAMSEYTEAC